ncbi:MAG TPA: ferritin-like domain-containing protein [Acidimicrobiales bacterium]|nr:ferritin-like domain-containing protein [Acidimicrobiales bacterium]
MTATRRENFSEATGELLFDVTTLGERARQSISKGPLADADRADLSRLFEVLNLALAIELSSVLHHKRHFFAAEALNAEVAANEFLELAVDESEHAERIAARILQLGGEPDFNLDGLTGQGQSQFDSSVDLESMIREDLAAERAAVAVYREIVNWVGDDDPISRRMLQEIVSAEEEHAEDILDLFSGAFT